MTATRLIALGLRVVAVAACLVVGYAGCGGSPSSPSSATLTGSWIGTYRDANCGNGTIENTSFQQSGTNVTGRFALRLFEAPCSNGPGWSITGTVEGTAVKLTGRPDWTSPDRQFGVCSIELEGTRAGDDRISGTHRWTSCSLTNDGRALTISGTFEMQRR